MIEITIIGLQKDLYGRAFDLRDKVEPITRYNGHKNILFNFAEAGQPLKPLLYIYKSNTCNDELICK